MGALSWRCICGSVCMCCRKTVKHTKDDLHGILHMSDQWYWELYCSIPCPIPCLLGTFPDLPPACKFVLLCCRDKIFIKKHFSEPPLSFKCTVSFCFYDSEFTMVFCLTGPARLWSQRNAIRRLIIRMINGTRVDVSLCLPPNLFISSSSYIPVFAFVGLFPPLFNSNPFPTPLISCFPGVPTCVTSCHLSLSFLLFHCDHFCYCFAIIYTSLFCFWPLLIYEFSQQERVMICKKIELKFILKSRKKRDMGT